MVHLRHVGLLGLLLGISAKCPTVTAAADPEEKTIHLRAGKSNTRLSSSDPHDDNRRLATTSVPFKISLTMTLGQSAAYTAPSSNDSNKVKTSVQNWFGDETKKYFTTGGGYLYYGTACTPENSSWNANSGYLYSYNCNANFDNTKTVPTSNQLVSKASSSYAYKNYIATYLIPILSSNSVLQNVIAARYQMTSVANPAAQTTPATPRPTTARPNNVPAPAPSPNGNVATVVANMEWDVNIHPGQVRQPSAAEYNQFLDIVNTYMNGVLKTTYGSSNPLTLTSLTTQIVSKQFSSGSTPHNTIVTKSTLTFTLGGQGQTAAPNKATWVNPLKQASLTSVITELQKTSGLWKFTSWVEWFSLPRQ